MSILLATIVDASIVLTLGLLATALLWNASAARRHAILATAILAASAMPMFELLLPQLPVVHWYEPATSVSSGMILTSDAAAGASIEELVATGTDAVPPAAVFVVVWVLGAAAIFAGLVTGLVRLARLRARCTRVTGGWRELTDELARECGVRRQVTLLRSEDPSLLVTCGVLRPAIILPASAATWSDDRIRIVLRHELAHIRRHDAAIQLAGEALRILHWANPLAWIACRRLRQECEYACDDAVLSGGVEGTEYATHLLEVARHLSGRSASWASAPAIAHSSTLERRIVAMLQGQRNRAPLGRRGWVVAALGALAVSIPLAAAGVAPQETAIVTSAGPREAVPASGSDANGGNDAAAHTGNPTTTRQAMAAISGRVVDQFGGAIPGVRLTLTDPRNGTQLVQQTNASGEFNFRDLPPGRYELVAGSPGFTTINNLLTVGSGATIERTITLPLGTVQETIVATCSTSPVARAARAIGAGIFPVLSAQGPPTRVGGKVKPPLKLKDVRPVCPASVPPGETVVRLTGKIGVDGFMHDVKPVPEDSGTAVPAELTESALDAVRQWTFSPTLLNGQPVATEMTVNITFKRP